MANVGQFQFFARRLLLGLGLARVLKIIVDFYYWIHSSKELLSIWWGRLEIHAHAFGSHRGALRCFLSCWDLFRKLICKWRWQLRPCVVYSTLRHCTDVFTHLCSMLWNVTDVCINQQISLGSILDEKTSSSFHFARYLSLHRDWSLDEVCHFLSWSHHMAPNINWDPGVAWLHHALILI